MISVVKNHLGPAPQKAEPLGLQLGFKVALGPVPLGPLGGPRQGCTPPS